MVNILENKLKEKISSLIEELEIIIGYSESKAPLKINPVFIKTKEEIDRLIFNNLCVNNLATYSYYLSADTKGKIGIILKPCDVKSIIQLISEELLIKNKIKTIVIGCNGIIDYKKINKAVNYQKIISAKLDENNITVNTIDKSFNFKLKDFFAQKCYVCNIYDNPPYYDEFIENDLKLNLEKKKEYEDIEEFEKSGLEKIYKFWEEEFNNCIRCYACRNICPLEVCRDKCIAQLDEPHWQSHKINSSEGKFFQLIRIFHLAGRCTECGECERVCPANIELLKLMKKVNQIILKLFDYRPGLILDMKPPLLTFKNVEQNIKDEELI
ncbi:MAG: 4Fe-4S dicluster domain-containing protein [Actinobacteria bacterium]|nr:4Fe-4S dicluster domain-containing protein [Actinomycetota bacterium]